MTRRVSAPLTAPPEGMPADLWSLIGRMRPEVRLRVLERAALLFDGSGGGVSREACDRLAVEQEAGVVVR